MRAAIAGGDDSADSGLAPLDSSRAPDLSVPKPALRISVAWLVVPCLACDFLMVPVLSSIKGPPSAIHVAIALGIVGCVLAQGNLLAAWLAWSDGPFLRRLATHWKIAASLYLIWLVGFGLARGGNREAPHIAATVALGVPLVSLAAQFPLWVAREWFGWRLVREQEEADHSGEPPLAIRDLMLATLVVAVSLALARLTPAFDAGEDVWPVWAVAVAFACVISSISLLPAGALLLRMRQFSRGLAWSGLYAGALIALPWIVAAAQWWYAPATLAPRAVYVGLSSLMSMFAATLILTALIARDRGYRLTGGNRRTHGNTTDKGAA